MPPRYAYWTILIDDKPTAFRAREQEELLPTLHQLRRTNKDVVLKWFARGRLWDTPEAAQAASRAAAPAREKRGHDWRPGRRAQGSARPIQEGRRNGADQPRSRTAARRTGEAARSRGASRFAAVARQASRRPAPPDPSRGATNRAARPRVPSRGVTTRAKRSPADRSPWRDKPRGAPPAGSQPWRDKPRGAPPGAQPWRDNPRRAAPRGPHPWRDKPRGAAARRFPAMARQTARRAPGCPAVARQTRRAPPRGGRPWRDRPKTTPSRRRTLTPSDASSG